MKNHRCSGKSFSELFCLGCRDKVVVGIISLASGEPRENNHFLLHDGDHSTMVEFWSESGPQCKLILSPFESTATWHHLRGINLRSAGRTKKKKMRKKMRERCGSRHRKVWFSIFMNDVGRRAKRNEVCRTMTEREQTRPRISAKIFFKYHRSGGILRLRRISDRATDWRYSNLRINEEQRTRRAQFTLHTGG